MSVYVDSKGYVVYTDKNVDPEEEKKAWELSKRMTEALSYEDKRKRAVALRAAKQRYRYLQRRQQWLNKWRRQPTTLAQEARQKILTTAIQKRKTNFRQIPWSERQKNNYVKFVRDRSIQ